MGKAISERPPAGGAVTDTSLTARGVYVVVEDVDAEAWRYRIPDPEGYE